MLIYDYIITLKKEMFKLDIFLKKKALFFCIYKSQESFQCEVFTKKSTSILCNITYLNSKYV